MLALLLPTAVQVAGVQYILDTVMQALQANPHRKFIYSEMVGPLPACLVVWVGGQEGTGWQSKGGRTVPMGHGSELCRQALILPAPKQAVRPHATPPFFVVLQSFFTRWWQQQDEDTRALVTQLVESGQVGGCRRSTRTAAAGSSASCSGAPHRWCSTLRLPACPLFPCSPAAGVCERRVCSA